MHVSRRMKSCSAAHAQAHDSAVPDYIGPRAADGLNAKYTDIQGTITTNRRYVGHSVLSVSASYL